MKLKKFNILNKMLIIFLIVQPFLDIYMAVVGERLDIFGISIATFVRILFIFTSFLIIVVHQIKTKENIKLLYLIAGYLFVVASYIIFHHLNIVTSNGYYITEGIYNFVTEFMYIARLVMPVLLMYNIIITKPAKNKIENAIVIAAVIVCTIIIVTNVFKVSFASYSGDKENITISYNFIDWFIQDNISYKESLSKGFFVSANQIGALLVVLLPIIMYYMFKKNKPYFFLFFFMQILAMILVGTRVASLGGIVICVLMILSYILLIISKKQRQPSVMAICMIVLFLETGLLLYFNSPAQNREFAESYIGSYDEEIKNKQDSGEYITLEVFNRLLDSEKFLNEYVGEDVSDKGIKYDAVCKYISNNHKYHYITQKYIYDIYPYEDDPEFWLDMFSAPISVKADNRARQVEIAKRIKSNNNNFVLDTLFGMGATPMNSRGYMVENDLISHYYNLGVVGIILFVAPFAALLIYILIKSRKQITSLLNLRVIAYIISICMTYFVGYFAGHVLDEYIVTIFLATIAATIFNLYSEGEIYEKS